MGSGDPGSVSGASLKKKKGEKKLKYASGMLQSRKSNDSGVTEDNDNELPCRHTSRFEQKKSDLGPSYGGIKKKKGWGLRLTNSQGGGGADFIVRTRVDPGVGKGKGDFQIVKTEQEVRDRGGGKHQNA